MATSGDRSQHFPAIEKKHGKPAKHWLKLLADLGDAKYQEQIDFLRENHGFSQAHANALVMHHRGSTTSKKFATPAEFFRTLDPVPRRTVQAIFAAVTDKHEDLELVTAWNQPMLRTGTQYVIGVSVSKNHILVNPFSKAALDKCAAKLSKYETNKMTIKVPLDWKVDAALLNALVKVRLAEIS